MKVAVPHETFPGERRVALTPASVPPLVKAGLEVLIESGAGQAAGFLDEEYVERGAQIVASRSEVFAADCVLQVRCYGANQQQGASDLELLREGQVLVGTCDPLGAAEAAQKIADRGVTLFALELIPRITRAQSMDVLSSQATVAGYRAVLLAATALPKMFPMMMTAAGTIAAAHVFVIGAGVAGLQAIATARKLGGVVSAYDVRPAVKEQVESLGAKFVEIELDTGDSEGKGGYAKAMDEEFYRKQRALMARVAAANDVVITTAAIPGRPSPLLVTADAVQGMKPGSVIVDLAAERGGNCELSQADQTVVEHGVTIMGPTNLPGEVPRDASNMFAKNVVTLLLHLCSEGQIKLDLEDEITRDTMAAHGGQITNARMRESLGQPPLAPKDDAGQAAAQD
ncbi:MAG: Re/Si-specific NAD(P)(+) transhydrogenase subunit alpha [Planctomycetota bacterium]|nr:MAG: Re/Si-specific NAD(P)(+) transhydrogenase subunit alpha [Planctomycetota bacterium]